MLGFTMGIFGLISPILIQYSVMNNHYTIAKPDRSTILNVCSPKSSIGLIIDASQ